MFEYSFPSSDESSVVSFFNDNLALKKELLTLDDKSYPSTYIMSSTSYPIPYRIGYQEYEIHTKSQFEEVMKCCLLTRHHDGFIREQYLKKLLVNNIIETYPFVLAYIIRLLGEYVKEIWELISDHIDVFPTMTLKAFVRDNQSFIEKNEARNITYSNLYYKLSKQQYKLSSAHQVFLYLKGINTLELV